MTHIFGAGSSKVARIGQTEFWARNGFIQVEHPIDGHKTLTIREVLERANALSDVIRNSTEKDLVKYADTRESIQKFLEDIIEVVRIAREQGEFTDESMRRDRARRLPTSVRVPSSFGADLR